MGHTLALRNVVSIAKSVADRRTEALGAVPACRFISTASLTVRLLRRIVGDGVRRGAPRAPSER